MPNAIPWTDVLRSCCEQNHSSLKAAGRARVFIKCYENVGTNDNSKSIASKYGEKKTEK